MKSPPDGCDTGTTGLDPAAPEKLNVAMGVVVTATAVVVVATVVDGKVGATKESPFSVLLSVLLVKAKVKGNDVACDKPEAPCDKEVVSPT